MTRMSDFDSRFAEYDSEVEPADRAAEDAAKSAWNSQKADIERLNARLKVLQDAFEAHYLMGSFGFIDVDTPELLQALLGASDE